MSTDPSTVVPALLAAAGLAPSPGERAQLIAEYPSWQAQLATLHALPAARDEQPATVFRAEL